MGDGLKVGDMFVIRGVATRVLKIAEQKNLDGEVVPYIFYGPYFAGTPGHNVVRSIPIGNFGFVNRRNLITKKRATEVLAELMRRDEYKGAVVVDEALEVIERDSIDEKVKLVKRLWWEAKGKRSALPYNKSNVFKRAMGHIAEELAVVLGMEPKVVEEQILVGLGGGSQS